MSSVSQQIENFIATNGVRRFDSGEGSSVEAIRYYLQRHGYTLTMERGLYKITGRRIGRPKRSGWKQIIEFVDLIRASEGKPPFRRVA